MRLLLEELVQLTFPNWASISVLEFCRLISFLKPSNYVEQLLMEDLCDGLRIAYPLPVMQILFEVPAYFSDLHNYSDFSDTRKRLK